MLPAKFIERYRIDKPDRFRLAEIKTADTAGLNLDKDDFKDLLKEDAKLLGELRRDEVALVDLPPRAVFQQSLLPLDRLDTVVQRRVDDHELRRHPPSF